MKVLVPVEDLLFGKAIVDFIGQHDWKPGTEFLLVSVIEPYLVDHTSHAPFAKLMEISREQVMSVAASLLDNLAASIIKKVPSAKVSKQVIEGHIKDEIISAASTFSADMILAGSHGRGGFSRFSLGSVSLMLISEAPCPVLLIKPDTKVVNDEVKSDAENVASKSARSRRILIALDETKSADEIVDLVKEHEWGNSATFKLISVLRNPHTGMFPTSPALDEYYEDSLRLCSANMKRLAAKLSNKYGSDNVVEEILNGDPKQAIVEDARLWGADLVVLGCRYRNPQKRAVLGSVSLAVLSTAPCSVLLLRQSGAADRYPKMEGDLAQQEIVSGKTN